jgi:hypothetical protein
MRRTNLSSGLSKILTTGTPEDRSMRATSSSLLSWPNRICVKSSRLSSTPVPALISVMASPDASWMMEYIVRRREEPWYDRIRMSLVVGEGRDARGSL